MENVAQAKKKIYSLIFFIYFYINLSGSSTILTWTYLNNSLVICAPPDAEYLPMRTSKDHFIRVNATKYSAESYASVNNISVLKNTLSQTDVFFLDADPRLGYQKISEILIPIYTLIYNRQHTSYNSTLVLTHNQIDQIDLIRTIYDGNITLSSNSNFCFGEGIFLSSSSSQPYNVPPIEFFEPSRAQYIPETILYDTITRINENIFKELKEKMYRAFLSKHESKSSQSPKKHIVIDSSYRRMIPQIQALYPNAKVESISDTDSFDLIVELMSKADIFITSNVKTAAYSIFMNENKVLMEIAPNGFGCFKSCSKWASLSHLIYFPVVDPNEQCLVKSFEDYFRLLPTAEYMLLSNEGLKMILDPLMQ